MDRKKQKRNIFIICSVIPPLAITVVFLAIPAFRALVLSFTNANAIGIGGTKFVGLKNYTYMFNDAVFRKAFFNTLKLLIFVPLCTITISVVLSEILCRGGLKEAGFYRVVYFFPSIISLTVVAIVWSFIMHPTMGILNKFISFIGLESMTRSWLGDSETALSSVAAVLVWQAAGYYMVMILAAMSGINKDYYEAAKIDGAGSLRQFFYITLPEIKNIILITTILSMSGTLNLSFTLTTIMTNGGPNNASLVLLKYIYNQGMVNGNFGYSMAITVFTLVFAISLSLIVKRLQREERR